MAPAPQLRIVLQSTRFRDAVIGSLCALGIMGIILYGVLHVGEKPRGNTLTGRIVGKEFIPLKEQMVEFSGRRLKGTRESKGEFIVKVRVPSEDDRIYEVPVSETTYRIKNEGDSLTFVRPRSEQK